MSRPANQAKPKNTISGPMRFAGRRLHSTRPVRHHDQPTRSVSAAVPAGEGAAPPVRIKAARVPPAASASAGQTTVTIRLLSQTSLPRRGPPRQRAPPPPQNGVLSPPPPRSPVL